MLFLQLYLFTSGLYETFRRAHEVVKTNNTDLINSLVSGVLFHKCSDSKYYQTLKQMAIDPTSTVSFALKDDLLDREKRWRRANDKVSWKKFSIMNITSLPNEIEFDLI